MPRAEKKVNCRIMVTVMRAAALRTNPVSLIQARSPFRAGDTSACGAGLRTQILAHFLISRAIPNGLVREHAAEGGPAYIANALGHAGLTQSFAVDVANSDEIELFGEATGQLMQSVLAPVRNLGMDVLRLALVLRPLRRAEFCFEDAEVAGIAYLLACRERGEVLEAQVDADDANRGASIRGGHFNRDIQIPVPARVLIETGAVANLAFGERAAVEDLIGLAVEPESAFVALNVASFERNPAQGLLAAPAQIRAFVLLARLDVLLADLVNRPSVQAKFFACAAGEAHKLKRGRPPLAPFQRLLLNIVAVIPDKIHRFRLATKFAVERFHAVFVGQNHDGILAQGDPKKSRRGR
jgi:hypothetical protein